MLVRSKCRDHSTVSNVVIDANMPYNMKAAMRNGLVSSSSLSLPKPPFSCSTGNCTWNAFATLAVGTQCEDIKSLVYVECSQDPQDYGCYFKATGDESLVGLLNHNKTDEYTVLLMQAQIPTQIS